MSLSFHDIVVCTFDFVLTQMCFCCLICGLAEPGNGSTDMPRRSQSAPSIKLAVGTSPMDLFGAPGPLVKLSGCDVSDLFVDIFAAMTKEPPHICDAAHVGQAETGTVSVTTSRYTQVASALCNCNCRAWGRATAQAQALHKPIRIVTVHLPKGP